VCLAPWQLCLIFCAKIYLLSAPLFGKGACLAIFSHLPPQSVKLIKQFRDRGRAVLCRGNLIRLGTLFGTDKWGSHWYLQHYQQHFQKFRNKKISLLEIGIGGYSKPNAGGHSLRTWKAYFPKARIYGIDIYDKRSIQESRIKTFKGSQVDSEFLVGVVKQIGGVDIIIDDGSHINEHVIRTFEILFPLLNDGGVYAVEDTQTSYWPGFGGSSTELSDEKTIMGYFSRLLHCLNYEEIIRPGTSPSFLDTHIVSIHFYHNLIFVNKGNNLEGSTVLRNNYTESRVVLEGIPDQPH